MPRVLLGCHALAWRAGGSLLSFLRFHCGTKGLALCGVLLPSTPLWNVVAWFCAAILRYSSLMFQAPLWTSAKASKYRIWSFLPALPLSSAASRLPVSFLVWVVPVSVFWSCPPLSAPSACFGCCGFFGCAFSFGSSLSLVCFLRWVLLCRCFGLLPSY